MLETSNNVKPLHPKIMDDKQIYKIRSIAQQFLEIENLIRKQKQKIKSSLELRVLRQKDWIEDFEIEATMTCFVYKNNISTDVDEDGILCVVPDYNISNQRDWNEQLDPRLAGDFHCGSFWWLYSAMKIPWESILKIESIYLDLTVVHQKEFKIKVPN